MTTPNTITFGVELEFLVPFLRPDEVDPAAGTDERRPVTRVSGARTPFSAVQVEIYGLLKSHNIPVRNSPGSSSEVDRSGATVYLPQEWCIDEDQSVAERREGFGYSWASIELRSPVLAANTDSYLHVSQVVTLLRERFRIRVNQSTGFHVHVGMGADPLPPRVVHRLAQLLWCADGMLSGLHPPERAVGFTAAPVRHTSYLARGEVGSWEWAQRSFEASTAEHRKPPKRETRRGSLGESAAIRDRLRAVGRFPSLRRVAALTGQAAPQPEPEPEPEVRRPRAPVRDRRDERAFIRYRMKMVYDTAEDARYMHRNMDEIQKELFGDWEFPKPVRQDQRDESHDRSAKNDVPWIMDTETMVSRTWAQLMNQELVSNLQDMSIQEVAPEDSRTSPNSSEHQLVTDKNGKSPAVPVQGREREVVDGHTGFFFNARKNPFEDPGARSRHLAAYASEMPNLTKQQWLEAQAITPPIPLLEGLHHLTDPTLHQDTRRAAHLVSSAAGHRCNYNLNAYGFPRGPKRPLMTTEFREATGSMNPAWVAAWASICAGLVEFCLAAGRDRFADVLMRVVEAEVNEELVSAGARGAETGAGGRASLLGYDVVSFLADVGLPEEASYVDVVLGRQDRDAFWFPCGLVRKSMAGSGGWRSPQAVGEGRAVLPPETDRY